MHERHLPLQHEDARTQQHNTHAHSPSSKPKTTTKQRNQNNHRHEFPQWRPQDLSRVFPTLEEAGLDLLRAMLEYDPAKRISVRGGGWGG